jgi:hypothetical protein
MDVSVPKPVPFAYYDWIGWLEWAGLFDADGSHSGQLGISMSMLLLHDRAADRTSGEEFEGLWIAGKPARRDTVSQEEN